MFIRSRNRVGVVGSSTTIGELWATYVTSPFASVDSSIVRVALYILCMELVGSRVSAGAVEFSTALIGFGGGGGLNGWNLPERICCGKGKDDEAGLLSRCLISASPGYDSAFIAARNSSVSAFHRSCCEAVSNL